MPFQASSIRPGHKRIKLAHSPAGSEQTPRFALPQLAVPEPSEQQQQPAGLQPDATDSALSSLLFPPHLAHLRSRYKIVVMLIKASSKIHAKVDALLKTLATFSFANLCAKPMIVLLHARGPATPKMTTVIEIAKREIEKSGGKWWQYSRLSDELEGMTKLLQAKEGSQKGSLVLGKSRNKTKADNDEDDNDNDIENENEKENDEDMADEESAFETMAQPPEMITARPKLHSVPTMTVYLSQVEIPELNQDLGQILARALELFEGRFGVETMIHDWI